MRQGTLWPAVWGLCALFLLVAIIFRDVLLSQATGIAVGVTKFALALQLPFVASSCAFIGGFLGVGRRCNEPITAWAIFLIVGCNGLMLAVVGTIAFFAHFQDDSALQAAFSSYKLLDFFRGGTTTLLGIGLLRCGRQQRLSTTGPGLAAVCAGLAVQFAHGNPLPPPWLDGVEDISMIPFLLSGVVFFFREELIPRR